MSRELVLGIFVGGKSLRMGVDKASLPAPGGAETLLGRMLRVGREAGFEVVLVGEPASRSDLDALCLRDEPQGVGPLGGLGALLRHANAMESTRAIAVACDMPYVSVELLKTLAGDRSTAGVLAARDVETHKWEPLCARYEASVVLPAIGAVLADGKRSFQALLERTGCDEWRLDEQQRAELRDWDVPQDVGRPF